MKNPNCCSNRTKIQNKGKQTNVRNTRAVQTIPAGGDWEKDRKYQHQEQQSTTGNHQEFKHEVDSNSP